MLNKPPGYVTTLSDDRGRKTVAQLVAGAGTRVYPVGRLDMFSEGLLLLTNDGAFAHAVMHPALGKAKTYEVRVRGDAVDVADAARRLREPMMLDSRTVQAVSVQALGGMGRVAPSRGTSDVGGGRAGASGCMGGEALLRLVLREGRNRQIRRMCAACGLSVLSLKRVAIGALGLGDLAPGRWRYLTDEERKSLCKDQ
jgi:23S rRNA pseudouridine2605 synthase